MMITNEDVKKTAFLSRIKIDDNKVANFAEEFNKTMSWIEDINELNTDNIEPLTCVNDTTLILREDTITQNNLAQEVLQNAPQKEFDYFIVPKVVE